MSSRPSEVETGPVGKSVGRSNASEVWRTQTWASGTWLTRDNIFVVADVHGAENGRDPRPNRDEWREEIPPVDAITMAADEGG